jgi:hypothetical protein
MVVMDTNIPVFTVKEPCFMMGVFDEESHINEDFFAQFADLEKKFLNRPSPETFISAYLDGELEDWLGFDIPVWLAGTWDLAQDIHDCQVWNYEGTECRDAKIVRCKNGLEQPNRIQFLIVVPEVAEETRKAVVM